MKKLASYPRSRVILDAFLESSTCVGLNRGETPPVASHGSHGAYHPGTVAVQWESVERRRLSSPSVERYSRVTYP